MRVYDTEQDCKNSLFKVISMPNMNSNILWYLNFLLVGGRCIWSVGRLVGGL